MRIANSSLVEVDLNPGRLLKNAHLWRYPHSSSLRRTSMYASFLGISGALHLDIFQQPAHHVFFSNLLAFLSSGILL
jgi:hypothetical protein